MSKFNAMKVRDVLAHLRKPGKAYAQVAINRDDTVNIQVVKVDMIFQFEQFDLDMETLAIINNDGDLVI